MGGAKELLLEGEGGGCRSRTRGVDTISVFVCLDKTRCEQTDPRADLAGYQHVEGVGESYGPHVGGVVGDSALVSRQDARREPYGIAPPRPDLLDRSCMNISTRLLSCPAERSRTSSTPEGCGRSMVRSSAGCTSTGCSSGRSSTGDREC
jgi:hypothetical protein